MSQSPETGGPAAGASPRATAQTALAENAAAPDFAAIDLDSPEYYLNRELTWLSFNQRVLREAQDPRAPLLERFKFLSITASNLDEFFMKRIGGLKQQQAAGIRALTVDGRTPREQIQEAYEVVRADQAQQEELFRELRAEASSHGLELANYVELPADDRLTLRTDYLRNVYPLVTPQAMDPAHPFPFISGLSLNLLVRLRRRNESISLLARVKVPLGGGIPRFMRLGDAGPLVALEDVMAHNLDLLFPDMEVESAELFRVTRNANLATDEDQADDLLSMIESELRQRKFAPIVRLEVQQGMSETHRGMLAAELGLDEASDVFEIGSLLGMRDLMEIAEVEFGDGAQLRDPAHHPVDHQRIPTNQNLFHVLRNSGSILLHHPYESFATSVERFLYEAARDPKVRAIKMTLYRTSAESKITEHLMEAARNGKQVAVAVELKARFEESANIALSNRMEEAGIHVTYGVMGLKTHCKVILVVRQDYDGIRRYAHIGTGNYHAVTARLYSDLGLLTCDPGIGRDLTELFNFLTTGYKADRGYHKLLVAPVRMKATILEKIDREIAHARAGRPARIRFKLNALEDADVTRALYLASQARVPIDLVIRDTCRLRPGLPGLSESVRVLSIVGRFLEHARILHFENGGDPEYYIGSADCMKRNLESRVECMVPVEDPTLRADLDQILEMQLADRRSAWEMDSDGHYVQRKPVNEGEERGAQERLIAWTEARHREDPDSRQRRARSMARRWGH